MSDIPTPKINPTAFEQLKTFETEEPHRPFEFGRTALSEHGFIGMEDSYRPRWVEIECNRGTELVGMDARGETTVEPGEEKRIATFGLNGCTAVAVAVELPDGKKRGYVQHYNPLNRSHSGNALTEALNGIPTEAVSARAVIMTPGEWTQDPAAKWGMVAKDETLTGLLTAVTQTGLGPEADIQVYPYSEMLSTDRYDQGTLMVEFRADGQTTILAEAMPVRPLGETQ